MDTTTEALDALSEALRPPLDDLLLWTPAGLVVLATQIYMLRTGRTPWTDVRRWLWTFPAFKVFCGVRECHYLRWPPLFVPVDPISWLGKAAMIRAAQQARRDLERARSA